MRARALVCVCVYDIERGTDCVRACVRACVLCVCVCVCVCVFVCVYGVGVMT